LLEYRDTVVILAKPEYNYNIKKAQLIPRGWRYTERLWLNPIPANWRAASL